MKKHILKIISLLLVLIIVSGVAAAAEETVQPLASDYLISCSAYTDHDDTGSCFSFIRHDFQQGNYPPSNTISHAILQYYYSSPFCINTQLHFCGFMHFFQAYLAASNEMWVLSSV